MMPAMPAALAEDTELRATGAERSPGAPAHVDIVAEAALAYRENIGNTLRQEILTRPELRTDAAVSLFSSVAKQGNGLAYCKFPVSSVEDLRVKIKSESALLTPVYSLGRIKIKGMRGDVDFGLVADWDATTALHRYLTKSLKWKLLPVSASKKYDALLRVHLQHTLKAHIGRIKAAAGIGGLFPQIADLGKTEDATDPNKQIAGPFNSDYFKAVIKGVATSPPGYLVSPSDPVILTAYFSTLIHSISGDEDKFPAPNGQDLNSVLLVKSVWESFLASYSYYLGAISQDEAQGAALSVGTRMVRLTGQGLVAQWKVLGPEYAAAGSVLERHAISRVNTALHLSMTPTEQYSDMVLLGFNSLRLQCASMNSEIANKLGGSGAVAKGIWGDISKESVPMVGDLMRGSANPNSTRGCVGWGCDRTIDVVRDDRFKRLAAANQALPETLTKSQRAELSKHLLDALNEGLKELRVSGAITSGKLK